MLDKWRKVIDEIDNNMVKELEERFEMVRRIGEEKQKSGKNIFDRSREEAVLKKVRGKAESVENAIFLETVFSAIMETSRKIQAGARPKQVGFPGMRGAFAEEALKAYFGRFVEMKPLEEYEDIVSEVASGELDYGILPLENSAHGAINGVYDVINKFDIYIVGEKLLKLDHHLVGLKDSRIEDITHVYSHTQAFHQCKNYMAGRKWERVLCYSSESAADEISKLGDPTKAAITCARAAEVYGLEILRKRINTNVSNSTRYIIVSNKQEVADDADKTSIMVTLPHVTGSLNGILDLFVKNGVNMLRIESRPIEGRTFEYQFFIELEGSLKEEKIKMTMSELGKLTTTIRILGSYKSDNIATNFYE